MDYIPFNTLLLTVFLFTIDRQNTGLLQLIDTIHGLSPLEYNAVETLKIHYFISYSVHVYITIKPNTKCIFSHRSSNLVCMTLLGKGKVHRVLYCVSFGQSLSHFHQTHQIYEKG